MTPKEARKTIDVLSMRIFEIEDIEDRLKEVKIALRDQIEELEWITDPFFRRTKNEASQR